MLEHAGKISIRETSEIKIAERSKTTLELWEKSFLEIAKVGAVSTKQNIQSFQNPSRRTPTGVKYCKKVVYTTATACELCHKMLQGSILLRKFDKDSIFFQLKIMKNVIFVP